MTSKLTREENVQAVFDLKAGYTLGLADVEILKRVARMALAAMDSEPVAWTWQHLKQWHVTNDEERARDLAWDGVKIEPLYRHAQPSLVPDKMTYQDGVLFVLNNDMSSIERGTVAMRAWNACRAAMLQGADGKPELTVWYGAMPETNGKTNWTAILHREGQHPWEGITIDRSEYPDRVRYEADRMRHLIGELADEPDILAYDAEAHSGYVYPGNSPVIPDGYVMVPKEPTKEMIDAGWLHYMGTKNPSSKGIYKAMLAAATQEVK
ncbi:TPA: hypothetical protein ACRI53_004325 [Klebsiella michiganensis]